MDTDFSQSIIPTLFPSVRRHDIVDSPPEAADKVARNPNCRGNIMYFSNWLNLHIFEGGAAGGSAAGSAGAAGTSSGTGDAGSTAAQGVNSEAAAPKSKRQKQNPLANVRYGIQPQEVTESQVAADSKPQDNNAAPRTFDDLISNEYKADFDNRVQQIVQSRLKNSKATEERLRSVEQLIDLVAQRYGLQADENGNYNIERLTEAYANDSELYESEAMERGIPVETYMRMQRMERENARMMREQAAFRQEQERQQQFQQLVARCETVKQVYPNFDLTKELQNPAFGRLVANNVDPKTAYEVAHHDELVPMAMQFAVQNTAAQVASAVASGANRPTENGISGQSAVVTKTDPRSFTKEDRAEIRRRVARGEIITF